MEQGRPNGCLADSGRILGVDGGDGLTGFNGGQLRPAEPSLQQARPGKEGWVPRLRNSYSETKHYS